jgi:hypothetical protein
MIANAKAICEMDCGRAGTEMETDGVSEGMIHQKVHGYEHLIGTIDACFSEFAQISPTPTDMMHARKACGATMREW